MNYGTIVRVVNTTFFNGYGTVVPFPDGGTNTWYSTWVYLWSIGQILGFHEHELVVV